MEILIFIVIIIIFAGVIFYLKENPDFLKKFQMVSEKKEQRLPYKRKDFLLTTPERNFFEGLQQIIPNNYVVFPQIVLSAIVNTTATGKEFHGYRSKINKKTVDFVIFEKQYLKPIIVIEYDDKTHYRKNRQIRDSFVDRVLKASEIDIIHIKYQQNINFEEMKNKINDILRV